jgi:2-dehydropantoate 2-reductase
MKILVYGAGVIGTLYAARLQQAGHAVTVLARGLRLADIRRHGLALQEVESGVRSVTEVATTERLEAQDSYDLAVITVRRDQLSAVLPDLAANGEIPTILFMLNIPLGSASLAEAVGTGRVLCGFPGAGGTFEGHVVHYAMIAQQPTTLGEPAGRQTSRVRGIAETMRSAGFRTRIDADMDAWLSAHALFVTGISGAIYLAGGDCGQLSRSEPLLNLMVNGVREGFHAVRKLGHPIHPFALKVLFTWLPRWFAVRYWRRFFSTTQAEYVFTRHARHASGEMRALVADCRQLLESSGSAASSLSRLYGAVDEYAESHS